MTTNLPPALVFALGLLALLVPAVFLWATDYRELAALVVGIAGGVWSATGIRLAYADRDALRPVERGGDTA